MEQTVSAASVMADTETSRLHHALLLMLVIFAAAHVDANVLLALGVAMRSSVTVTIGLRPAFSDRVYGMISSASASRGSSTPRRRSACGVLRQAQRHLHLGAPPPAISAFLTRQRMTQSVVQRAVGFLQHQLVAAAATFAFNGAAAVLHTGS